jgi:hypothetical protein
MAFGVDTVKPLDTISRSSLHAWKGQYPTFAGRYFGGGYTWSGTEFTSAKASTHNTLAFIAPLRASTTDQSLTGSAGNSAGSRDATDTCTRVTNAINAAQLNIPVASGLVIVYLDNEPYLSDPNVLTADYWAGWANTMFHFKFLGSQPFRPGLYCTFMQDSSGKWVPDTSMQAALNEANNRYPNDYTLCSATWTFLPHTPVADYCPANSVPNWSMIGNFAQNQPGGAVTVPTYLWQYASPVACTAYPSFAGGQKLDMDGSDATPAETFMLTIS